MWRIVVGTLKDDVMVFMLLLRVPGSEIYILTVLDLNEVVSH
jgi:hypothetical protein